MGRVYLFTLESLLRYIFAINVLLKCVTFACINGSKWFETELSYKVPQKWGFRLCHCGSWYYLWVYDSYLIQEIWHMNSEISPMVCYWYNINILHKFGTTNVLGTQSYAQMLPTLTLCHFMQRKNVFGWDCNDLNQFRLANLYIRPFIRHD